MYRFCCHAPVNRKTPETGLRARLQRTIDLVWEGAARIELWACALNGFAQPDPDNKHLLGAEPNQR